LLEHALGSKHPDVLHPLRTLAGALALLGQDTKALQIIERGLHIAQEGDAPTNIYAMLFLSLCAQVEAHMHDDRAPKTARAAYESARELFGIEHATTTHEIAAGMFPIGLGSWLDDETKALQSGDSVAVDRVASLADDAERMGFAQHATAARNVLVAMLASIGRTEQAMENAQHGLTFAEKAGDETAAAHFRDLLEKLSSPSGA